MHGQSIVRRSARGLLPGTVNRVVDTLDQKRTQACVSFLPSPFHALAYSVSPCFRPWLSPSNYLAFRVSPIKRYKDSKLTFVQMLAVNAIDTVVYVFELPCCCLYPRVVVVKTTRGSMLLASWRVDTTFADDRTVCCSLMKNGAEARLILSWDLW